MYLLVRAMLFCKRTESDEGDEYNVMFSDFCTCTEHEDHDECNTMCNGILVTY